MKQALQLRLTQHLTLTPQLQQSIRLLQLSTMELNQELEKFLMENPLLEKEDAETEAQPVGPIFPAPAAEGESPSAAEAPSEAPSEETGAQTEIDWYNDAPASGGGRDDAEDSDYPQVAAESPSLREHLLAQVSLTNIEPRDRRLVELLIDALEENGYLTMTLEELAELIPSELGVEPDELQIALRHLQSLDPTGVGARNAHEARGREPNCDGDSLRDRGLAGRRRGARCPRQRVQGRGRGRGEGRHSDPLHAMA